MHSMREDLLTIIPLSKNGIKYSNKILETETNKTSARAFTSFISGYIVFSALSKTKVYWKTNLSWSKPFLSFFVNKYWEGGNSQSLSTLQR